MSIGTMGSCLKIDTRKECGDASNPIIGIIMVSPTRENRYGREGEEYCIRFSHRLSVKLLRNNISLFR